MSRSRSQKPKVDNALNVEEFGANNLATPQLEGTDPDSLPFPEWSDQDINSEKWDSSNTIKEKPGQSQMKFMFEDPQQVNLPPSIAVHQWKRCSEIFPQANLAVVINKPTYPDLVSPNYHLQQSEFYRSFISSIETLLYLSSSRPFPEEYGSSSYSAKSDRAWRPWHQIYSNCKIVKGHNEHTPLYNPTGKYVVRLYWMGCWRKIYVDDLMPLDKTNALSLPSLYIPKTKSESDLTEVKPIKSSKEKSKGGAHAKKEVIEIWPMILCKALLKIGALSWSTLHELNDCDIINCLTGWVPQRIKTKGVSSSDLWDIFMAYVEHFEWEETMEGSTKKTGSSKSKTNKTEKAESPRKGTKGAKAPVPLGTENMPNGDRYLVVSCDNFLSSIESDKKFQNRDIGVFVSQVRNIPLIKPPPRPELEFWQTFRYEKWAVQRGIIPPDIQKLNIKSLKIVDPFKRIFMGTHETEELDETIQNTLDSENADKKSEKSSKSSKKRPTIKVPKHRLEPDPTMWIDFDEIKENINHITIYFQPRNFKSKTKVSDISFSSKISDFKQIVSPTNLKEVRNEPIYMLIDSIDYTFLLINLAQVGNMLQLCTHTEETEAESLINASCEVHDICYEIILKKTEVKEDGNRSDSQLSAKSVLLCNFNTKPISFALEEYCWTSNIFGNTQGMMQTVGSKSLLLNLKPGRKSFRLWISSHCSYVLQIFSDTPVTIGCLEEYMFACTAESQRLTNLCYELSSCYGKLVQSFGMPEYSICLRNFYHCYKPFENLTKRELVIVHNALFEEFCKVISTYSSSPGALKCIRLLFLQLTTFNYINPYLEDPHWCPSQLFNNAQVEYVKKMERAAVKIQAFFKGVYIRLLMKKLNESHKQYMGIFETLKKVYSEIFSSEKRLSYCPNLFRHLFERQDIKALREKFETYKDMHSVLNVPVFTNSIVVNEAGWVPICRYEFYINCIEPIYLKIQLFCNLKNYYVRVFNNDTEKEIKRYTSNVAVERYDSNIKGYTILCYGWAEDNTKLTWKLVLANKKFYRNDLVIFSSIPTVTINLKDCYMPNFDLIICRHIIQVGSDTTLTAHLRTSYDQVRICLKLLDANGKTLYEIKGVGGALLPVLYLKYKEENDRSVIRRNLKQRFSGMSDITYNKLHRNYGSTESTSISSASFQKKVSVGSDVMESGSKRNKKKSVAEGVRSEDDLNHLSRHGERSDRNGKAVHSKRIKGRQGDVSDSDSISETSTKRSSLKSKSFEKLNSRTFAQEKKRMGSRQSGLNIVEEKSPTEYILEGIVLDNSWPLTRKEWQQTQLLKEKNYLNLLGEQKQSASKKNLVTKKTEEPYWVLDLVHVSGDSLEFEQDFSKSEERKQLKMEWFENPERYRRGFELREAYLEENLVANSNAITDEATRSNDPKDFAVNIVKESLTEEFMLKPSDSVDEDTCKTKGHDDYCVDQSNIEQSLRAYIGEENAMHDDIEELLENQASNFEILSEWFSEIRNESMEMMCEAIKLENEYVKKVLESMVKSKGDRKIQEKKKKRSTHNL